MRNDKDLIHTYIKVYKIKHTCVWHGFPFGLTVRNKMSSVCALEASGVHVTLVFAEHWTRIGSQTIIW